MSGWCNDPHVMYFVDSIEKQLKDFREEYPNHEDDAILWLQLRLDDSMIRNTAERDIKSKDGYDVKHLDWALEYFKNGKPDWLETIIRTNDNILRYNSSQIDYARQNLIYIAAKLAAP